MSAWIVIHGDTERVQQGLSRFSKIFSFSDGQLMATKDAEPPPFTMRTVAVAPDLLFVLWSWRADECFPGIQQSTDECDRGLLISGNPVESHNNEMLGCHPAVVAQSLRTDAPGFLQKLNGSFSLCLVDGNIGYITLAADRIASRPVWYATAGGMSIAGSFASSIVPFIPDVRLDPAGLYSLFLFSRQFGDRGLFSGVYRLRGGEIVTLDREKGRRRTHWYQIRYDLDSGGSIHEHTSRISEALHQSRDRILRTNRNPYLFLSGGMDSRLAAAVLAPDIRSVTLTNVSNMNSRTSERIARKLNIDHETVYRDAHWYLNLFDEASLISGGGYKITHAHFIPFVKRRAAVESEATFILGDMLENFSKHYYRHLPPAVGKLFRDEAVESMAMMYSYAAKGRNEVAALFQPETLQIMAQAWECNVQAVAEEAETVSPCIEDRADALFRWMDASSCPTYLMHECILPYAEVDNLMYDSQLIDNLLKLPHNIKSDGGLVNSLIARENPQLLWIVNSNFWLPPITPGYILQAAKHIRPMVGRTVRRILGQRGGQPVIRTEGSWDMLHVRYRNNPEYSERITGLLVGMAEIPNTIFRSDEVQKYVRQFMSTDCPNTWGIELLLSLYLLMRQLNVTIELK